MSSHVIKGKAYFTDWSPNVKFEGLNVCRHTDPMTHNHS
ncbi:PAAR-like domain-containing protein [Ralstonia pseudosolanacearum]